MSDEKDQKFKVSDRRKFNPDGSPREQSDDAPEPELTPLKKVETSQADNVISFPADAGNKKQATESKPPVSEEPLEEEKTKSEPQPKASPKAADAPNELFISLLNMLGIEAAMYLGLIESPGEQQLPVDMEAARRMIDLLGVLKEKTQGNLAPQEAAMLDGVLNDLRMQFIALSKQR